MISIQNLSNLGPVQNRSRFIKTDGNLDFSEFLAEVRVVQLAFISNQIEYNAINQLSLTSLFFPITFCLSPSKIKNILT